MKSLKGKTLFITGASRGIGKAIALRAARDGARIIVAAKSAEEDPRLPGTIFSAAGEIQAAGGEALPLVVDVRDEAQVEAAVARGVEKFGGIDILVNNASAIGLSPVADTPMKRYDLMMDINVRGAYLCAKMCLPHLVQAENPHILTLSPPLNLSPQWFARHCAYTVSKYSMSLVSMGLAEELRDQGIASNALWPRTLIATAALKIASPGGTARARLPSIMADAAWHMLTQPSRSYTGQQELDEHVLRAAGFTDFTQYSENLAIEPEIDLFVDEPPTTD